MHLSPTLSKKILAWYDNNKRNLPWRVGKKSTKKLYYRLLSEFMLQQTQVKTAFHILISLLKSLKIFMLYQKVMKENFKNVGGSWLLREKEIF